ncbi:MAG: hypothetical protein DRN20_06880 [Thermoplasmata archaeon]|nr:MAG: hypothetical protein DRN20_06880 [Thermoplasmata archaeon]
MWTNDENDWHIRCHEIDICRSIFRANYIIAEGNLIRGYTWYLLCPFCGEKINITRPSSGGRPIDHYGVVVGHLNKHLRKYYERIKKTYPDGRHKYYYRCKICNLVWRERIGIVLHIAVRHKDDISC